MTSELREVMPSLGEVIEMTPPPPHARMLAQVGASATYVKNSLTARGLSQTKLAPLSTLLHGSTALVAGVPRYQLCLVGVKAAHAKHGPNTFDTIQVTVMFLQQKN